MKLKNLLWQIKNNLINGYEAIWRNKKDYDDAYSLDLDTEDVSDTAIESAKTIRGPKHPATLMVFGVAPRSGTNYIGNVIANHPDICAYPNDIYEIPFLRLTNKLKDFQDGFFGDYYRNIQRMKKNDFLPLFGASFIAHLYSYVPPGKIMLTKEPDARFLRYFPTVFPHENLLLVIRDGRDVADSAIKTWPDMSFKKICQRWNDSARLILDFQEKYKDKYLLVKYEDMLHDPLPIVESILQHYKLNPDTYPFDKIKSMPIVGSSTASKKDDTVNWKPVPANENFKPTNKWEKWTEKQKNIFKKIAGETLIAANYCDSQDW